MTQFENVNISKDVWQKWGTCDFETHEPVRNFEFPGGHSKILKSAESRKWTALQTYDKNEGRQREAKPISLNRIKSAKLGPHRGKLCLGNYIKFS